MKSVKRGRGPSFMGGFAGLAAAAFGLLWTILVASSGGGIFALFGLIFVAIGIVNAVYNFKNATGKNRYSEYDITENGEETDPLNEMFGEKRNYDSVSQTENRFCPYCGQRVEADFEFCNVCGKRLP